MTVVCPTCGQPAPTTAEDFTAAVAALLALRLTHTCTRYLIAEHWHNGELTSVWTSRRPGVTGPHSLVEHHAYQANDGWTPPRVEGGWTYRWAILQSANGA